MSDSHFYNISKVISGKQGRQPHPRTIASTGFYKSPVSQSKGISPAVTTETVSHILPDLPTQFQHPNPSKIVWKATRKDIVKPIRGQTMVKNANIGRDSQ